VGLCALSVLRALKDNPPDTRHPIPDTSGPLQYTPPVRLAALLFAITLASQAAPQSVERTSKPIPVISPVLATLESATGWTKTDTDQWISKENWISYRSEVLNQAKHGDISLGKDNFKKLEMRSISIGGKSYPLMIAYLISGAYKYPVLELEWSTFTIVRYFIFDKPTSAVAPKDPEMNRSYVLSLPLKQMGEVFGIDGRSEEELLKEIALEAASPLSVLGKMGLDKEYKDDVPQLIKDMLNSFALEIAVFPVLHEGKQKARFIYKVTNSKFDLDTTSKRYEVESFVIGKSIFDTHYYEMDWNPFYKFWNAPA
jgi:hypothetical protein